jgi:hypothetical protein
MTNAKNTRFVSVRVCIKSRFSFEIGRFFSFILWENYPTVPNYRFSKLLTWIFIVVFLKKK